MITMTITLTLSITFAITITTTLSHSMGRWKTSPTPPGAPPLVGGGWGSLVSPGDVPRGSARPPGNFLGLEAFCIRLGSPSTLLNATPTLQGASGTRLCRADTSLNHLLCGQGARKHCKTNGFSLLFAVRQHDHKTHRTRPKPLQDVTKTASRRPQDAQDVPKTPLDAPKTPQDAAKTLPRRFQDAPRRTQDTPRRPKTPPGRTQDAPRLPKAPPKRPENAPRRPHDASKTQNCLSFSLAN